MWTTSRRPFDSMLTFNGSTSFELACVRRVYIKYVYDFWVTAMDPYVNRFCYINCFVQTWYAVQHLFVNSNQVGIVVADVIWWCSVEQMRTKETAECLLLRLRSVCIPDTTSGRCFKATSWKTGIATSDLWQSSKPWGIKENHSSWEWHRLGRASSNMAWKPLYWSTARTWDYWWKLLSQGYLQWAWRWCLSCLLLKMAHFTSVISLFTFL